MTQRLSSGYTDDLNGETVTDLRAQVSNDEKRGPRAKGEAPFQGKDHESLSTCVSPNHFKILHNAACHAVGCSALLGISVCPDRVGKLHNLPKIAAFFARLNIPFPGLNAPFISMLEFAGGILFMLGLFSRPIAFLLACNMFVAYWTADHEAFVSIFSDPGKFYVADPYTFLFASLMVLIFGAGLYSVDTLIAKHLEGRGTGCTGCDVLQNDKMVMRSPSAVRSIVAGR